MAQFSEEDCGPTLLARGADPPAIRHVYSTAAAFFCLLARIHHPQEPDTLVAQFRRENCCLYGIFVFLDFIVMILAVIGTFKLLSKPCRRCHCLPETQSPDDYFGVVASIAAGRNLRRTVFEIRRIPTDTHHLVGGASDGRVGGEVVGHA